MEPKFKAGDRVRHLGSGQYAVVIKTMRACTKHPWSPHRPFLFAPCEEPTDGCDFAFDGFYSVQTGLGQKHELVNGIALTAAEPLA